MIRRSLLSCLLGLTLLFGAVPAIAQDAAPDAAQVPVRVALVTDLGTIVVETDPRAPLTSANFLRYVDQRRLDGLTFYRGMQLGPDAGLVQGGASGARSVVLPPVAHEPTIQTGLTHTEGALSMAQSEPGTATADFFIVVGNLTSLDAGKTTPDDPGFAVFGRVIEGMDVVRAMLAAPKSETEGDDYMRGQMLEPRVKIISARRVEVPAA
jgi:peptidyl-prolyl cis-trans isomerase A (cyclophilin A)